jgi:transposase
VSVKRKFTKQYKQEALEHWKSSGRSAATIAAELGIRPPLLYRWQRQRRVDAAGVAAARGGKPGGVHPTPKMSGEEMQERIRHLEQENAKLLEQREVLKKSLGILCEAPRRSMPKSNA